MRLVTFYAIPDADGEEAGPMKDQPWHVELGGDIDGPWEEHVGDDAVRAVLFDELFEGVVEEREGLGECDARLLAGEWVEILDADGEASFDGGELEEVDGDGVVAGEAGGPVDGGLDLGSVEGRGDNGDMNPCTKGKELCDVYHGNEVALGH